MVNWVQVQRKYQLCRLAKNAGLRQHAVAVDDDTGTVVNFWLPKHKAPPKKKKNGGEEAEKQRRHAVVLVHGFAGDGLMTWAFQMGPLGRQCYDVYVPDLVHFGGSSTSPSPDTTTTGFQAASIAAALGKLGVERCTAVGFSYGWLVMYSNRKERAEMLESSVIKDNQVPILTFQQDILLLWGESDQFFPIDDAKRLKEELGEKATLRSIRKAGHLAHLERPCVYNRCLKEFLARVNAVSAS